MADAPETQSIVPIEADTALVMPMAEESEPWYAADPESVHRYWAARDTARLAAQSENASSDAAVNTFAALAIAFTSAVLATMIFIGH